ncbi:MAG: 4'-phosphopantetheinyl transferase superfamily protein [Sphingomonadaceae bacterium]|nr:4'-phosphopantetheinyl transferase superfamily protein [Sphingomonadaceae bacterium]
MTAALFYDTLEVDESTLLALTEMLGADERIRAAHFRFARDRRRFVARRARLRQRLGAWVGRAPERLVFGASSHGKPTLAGGPHFSLSHSAEAMMLAIGDGEIGCDIERIDDDLDWRPLAEAFFTNAERAGLAALSRMAARRAFFACWVRKEAFVKALGIGLSWPLGAFDVAVGPRPAIVSGGAGWAIAAAPRTGFATAIVARDDGNPLTVSLVDKSALLEA